MIAAIKASSSRTLLGLWGDKPRGASDQVAEGTEGMSSGANSVGSSAGTSGEGVWGKGDSQDKSDSLALLNRSPDAGSTSRMRRNESAAAALQSLGQAEAAGHFPALVAGSGMRKNKSFAVPSHALQAELSQPQSEATRALVCEACALHLEAQIQTSSAEESAAVVAALKDYVETICRQLHLPNSCIIAMVIYLDRLIANSNFELTALNWQPSVLSGFVVAAKLCFDEPVWNEDFLRALRISNVQVGQISRWEVNFLKLIDFNTNVELADFADITFRLQERFFKQRNIKVQFFTFLMSVCKEKV